MSQYNELMGSVRSILSQSPVDYVALANTFARCEIPLDVLTDKIAPYIWDHLQRVTLRSYRINHYPETATALQGSVMEFERVETGDSAQQEVVSFTDRLFHGYAGFTGSEYDFLVLPSDALRDSLDFYVCWANYDSGDSFGHYPDQKSSFAVVQGKDQVRRYLKLLEKRDPNRMSPLPETDPDYTLKSLLQLHTMKPWEGYFDRLNYIYLEPLLEFVNDK